MSEGYRGVHVFQHARFTETRIWEILHQVYIVVGGDPLKLPPGDDPQDDDQVAQLRETYPDYFAVLDGINESSSDLTATINSLKKIWLTNLRIMGLIKDVNRSEKKLTQPGLAVAKAKEGLGRRKLIMAALELALDEAGLLGRVDTLVTSLGYLSKVELMLIGSDLELADTEAIELVRALRQKRGLARAGLIADARTKCETLTASSQDRTGARDFGNWQNQAEQLLIGLSYVCGLAVNRRLGVIGPAGPETAEVFQPERSQRVRREAREMHGIESNEGWDLHHVIPVAYAVDVSELALIDERRNLLPLSREAHARIPTDGNVYIRLNVEDAAVTLEHPSDRSVRHVFEMPSEAYLAPQSEEEMIVYNQMLVTKFS